MLMLRNNTISNITAGFVATMVGLTSSVMIVFQAAESAGATQAELASWLLALNTGMCVTSIGLSLFYRIPILTAWATPGAVLLITSLAGIPMPEAIGAFIFSAILIILSGVTGLFKKLMHYIPSSLASAMLAGILMSFCANIFVAMQQQFLLVFIMFITYLIGKRFFPRFVILIVFTLGIIIAKMNGSLNLENFHVAISVPVFTAPVFSLSAMIGVGIPLFIVIMTSQNLPGVALINAAGYKTPISPIISWTGIVNLLLAPFGGFSLNIAVITSAICLSSEADPDPTERYKSAVYAGIFYFFTGLFGATIVTLFAGLPKALVLTLAGIALLGAFGNSLKIAVKDEEKREAAIITLLVAASNISFLGIGSAFWGIVAGVISLALLNAYKGSNFSTIKKIFGGREEGYSVDALKVPTQLDKTV